MVKQKEVDWNRIKLEKKTQREREGENIYLIISNLVCIKMCLSHQRAHAHTHTLYR